jgi:hypothetical protein
MGEIADWVNDDMSGWSLNNEYEYIPGPIRYKRCRYCGKSGLTWKNLGSKNSPIWRLSDKNGVHTCDAHSHSKK